MSEQEHDAICLSRDGGRHCDCQGLVRPMNFGACVADAMLDVMPGATFHDAAKLVAALRRSFGRAGIDIIEPPR